MNIRWNAGGYSRDFQFVHQYGEGVLDLLELQEGQTVLDLGCGNGALTWQLSQRGYRATGMDASPEMLEEARRRYPSLPFILGDAAHFQAAVPYDAIFSNAVFHWIDDQDGLLASVAASLKPGGQLVCEFGGKGCCEAIHQALEQAFERRGLPYRRTFYFPTVGEYAPKLEAYGLEVAFAALFDRPTKLTGERGVRDWILMFNQTPFAGLSDALREDLIEEAEEALRPALLRADGWYADYVRIRFRAIKNGRR